MTIPEIERENKIWEAVKINSQEMKNTFAYRKSPSRIGINTNSGMGDSKTLKKESEETHVSPLSPFLF